MERSLRRLPSSQVLVWLCLNIVPSDCQSPSGHEFLKSHVRLPLSISSAMAIIISYEFGARRMDAVKSYSKLGRLTALGFSIFTLIFLYFLRYDLAELYGHEP